MKSLNVPIDEGVGKSLKMEAIKQGKTLRDLVSEILQNFVKGKKQ